MYNHKIKLNFTPLNKIYQNFAKLFNGVASKPNSYFTGVLVSIVFFGIFGVAESSWAATINAVSCAQSDVQTAINAASSGDTVQVPAGSCIWSSQVSITNKNIIIQGAGIDTTIITANIISGVRPGVFKVTQKPAIITGFTFAGNAPTYGAHIVFEGTGTSSIFRVYGNKFTSNTAYQILVPSQGGLSYGLIDDNVFITSDDHSFIQVYGDNNRTSWTTEASLGTADAVYIENNTFTSNDPTTGNLGARPLTLDGGARAVFRFNNIVNQGFDAHGYCGDGTSGSRTYEVYNNAWSVNHNGDEMYRWMFIRGGMGVVFNNRMTLTSGSIRAGREVDLAEYRVGTYGPSSCSGAAESMCTTYPCLDQIGRGINQSLDPLYLWNNTIDGENIIPTVNGVGNWSWAPSLLYNSNTFIMVSPTVDNGYGYKATTFGTSGTSEPSWPGTIGNTALDGTVVWTNQGLVLNISDIIQLNRDYYTSIKPGYVPYTCPHPLTGFSGTCDSNIAGMVGYNINVSDTTPPSAPLGLSVL